MEPDGLQGYLALIGLHFSQDEPIEMGRYLDVAMTIAPTNPDLLYFKGQQFSREDKVEDAQLCFLAALGENPLHYQSSFALGMLSAVDLDETEAAIFHLRRVVEVAPDSAAAQVAGEVLHRLNA